MMAGYKRMALNREIAFIVFASILQFVSMCHCAVTNEDTLELLQLMIRHGNRTALQTFDPYVPWYIETFRPFQFGELTPQGRRQMWNVGTYIRQRYDHFLPDEFSYTDVAVQCTVTQRVQESAAITMAAIFPPKSKQKWQDSGLGAKYTPIPCDSVPAKQDIVLEPNSVDCPRYKIMFNEFLLSPEFIKTYIKLTRNGAVNIYTQLALNLSTPVHFAELGIVYENLLGMESFGMDLPSWSKPVYPYPIIPLVTFSFGALYWSPEMITLSVGEYLKEILEIASQLEKGELTPKSRKVFAYFGHDKTILPLLVALGFETVPPICGYGAAVIMELHRNKTTSGIGYKFQYRNSTWDEPITYTIPGCHDICPLSYVKKYVAKYLPTKPFHDYCK